MSEICFDKTFLILVIITITIIALYQYFSQQQIIDNIKNTNCPSYILQQTETCPICPSCKQSECNNSITIENPPENIQTVMQKLQNYDIQTLTNPLVPPLKRDDYTIPVIPVFTRGYPGSYKKMGTLIDHTAQNTDPYKFLFLIGRQKYIGSNIFDYYVTEKGSEGNGTLKFDLPHLTRELFPGDKIMIHQLNKEYTVTIDKSLGYEYNPYFI
jgi:hypothetical protein